MVTKAEQRDATRKALIDAGRALFAKDGFADTAAEAVVASAGVTRGALYHHFKDKGDLFRAVYIDVEQRLVAKVEKAVAGLADPVEILRRGSDAFLDACLDKAVIRIALLDGPAVLGWKTWREIDQLYGLGMVQATLDIAIQMGGIRKAPVEALAHVVLGALVEGSMFIANADDRAQARADVGQAIAALIDGLATAG